MNNLNITKLYQDYSIPIWTEGNNCQPGWVNTTCPFCRDTSNHLGYCIDQNYFNCWRCGRHSILTTISTLLGMSEDETKKVLKNYGDNFQLLHKPKKLTIRKKAFKFPSGTTKMKSNHKRYLEERGFDPDVLEHEWNLMGTGPISTLDGSDYKHRIIAPIVWDGSQVSFQGRAISKNQKLKYKACTMERELIHHKHILYGNQSKWSDTGICVEGITDVWRLGPKACATFGIEFTKQQVRVLAKSFKRIAVIFDDEPQAVRQAEKLVSELKFRNIDAFRIPIVGDPGGMTDEEVKYLLKQIF